MKHIYTFFVIGCMVLAACASTEQTPVSTAVATITLQPTSTEIRVLPTPSSPGDSILWDTLQVSMDRLEISQEYLTDFGSTRIPPEGTKLLWIHLRLKNTGQVGVDIPISEHFSILYAASELKPTYGHRAGYIDYTTLEPVIFPDQELDGWLRFDIPITAELKDLRFIFIPESSQVGTSYTSPNYPYAADKPTYVWNCTL